MSISLMQRLDGPENALAMPVLFLTSYHQVISSIQL